MPKRIPSSSHIRAYTNGRKYCKTNFDNAIEAISVSLQYINFKPSIMLCDDNVVIETITSNSYILSKLIKETKPIQSIY